MAYPSDYSDVKCILHFSVNDFQQTMCMIVALDMIYCSRSMKKADRKVTLFYPSPAFSRVQCSYGCHMLTCLTSHSN